jgi:hypothetical protein
MQHVCKHVITFREMKMLIVFFFWLYFGSVFDNLKLIYENLTNMFLLFQNCINFQGHLSIYGLIKVCLL